MAIPFAALVALVAGAIVYLVLVNRGEQLPPLQVRLFWSLAAAAGAFLVSAVLTRFSRRFRVRRSNRLQLLMAAEGLAHLRRGDLDKAERHFRACAGRDSENLPALQGLAEIALRQGDVEKYLQATNRLLALPADVLLPSERVALCHRQADLIQARLHDAVRAAEALARIELDYPNTADALRARRRIESLLAGPRPLGRDHPNDPRA